MTRFEKEKPGRFVRGAGGKLPPPAFQGKESPKKI